MADINQLALHHATQTTAVVWVRSTVSGAMVVTCNGSTFTGDTISTSVDDGCGVCTVTGLSAGQSYPYSVTVGGVAVGSGTLKTMPADGDAFSLAFGTCVMYSRDPLPVAMALANYPDLAAMCWLGDQIYTDEPKPSTQTANGETLVAIDRDSPLDETATMVQLYKHYRAWWQHPSTTRILRAVPNYFVGDDHDHGPGNDWDGTVAAANANVAWASNTTEVANMGAWCDTAFKAYCKGNPGANVPRYFSVRVNAALEMFFLDGVAHRDAADGTGTTLLGAAQLAWMQTAISTSTAPFKLIMCSKNLYGTADDFAQYPAEQAVVTAFLATWATWAVPGGALWCSGDIHYPAVWYDDTVPIWGIRSSPLSAGNATPGNGYGQSQVWKISGQTSTGTTAKEVPAAIAIIQVTGSDRMDVSLVDLMGSVRWTGYMLPGSNEVAYDDVLA